MAASLVSMQAAVTRTAVSATQTAAGATSSSASKVCLTAFSPVTSNFHLRTSMLPDTLPLRTTNARPLSKKAAEEPRRNAGKVFASVNGTGSSPGLPIDLRGEVLLRNFFSLHCNVQNVMRHSEHC